MPPLPEDAPIVDDSRCPDGSLIGGLCINSPDGILDEYPILVNAIVTQQLVVGDPICDEGELNDAGQCEETDSTPAGFCEDGSPAGRR